MLSFPRPGTSVALDIPIRPGRTQAAVDALNEVVIECGGRVYLAKDAFTRSQQFRKNGAAPRGVGRGPPSMGPRRTHRQRTIGSPFGRPPVNVVFLGATRGMGRALARRMVQRGDRLFLLGRNAARPRTQCTRPGGSRRWALRRDGAAAICSIATSFAGGLDRAEQQLAGLDAVVVTAARFATQEQLETDASAAR